MRRPSFLGLLLLAGACSSTDWHVRVTNGTGEPIERVEGHLFWPELKLGVGGGGAPLALGLWDESGGDVGTAATPQVLLRIWWRSGQDMQELPVEGARHRDRRFSLRLTPEHRVVDATPPDGKK